MKKRISLSILMATAIVVGPATADTTKAEAKARISAFVPTSCVMNIQTRIRKISANEYSVGWIDRDCNTPHNITVSYVNNSASGNIVIGNTTAPLGTSSSSVPSPAVRNRQEMRLLNVTEQTAQSVAQTLTISVTPQAL